MWYNTNNGERINRAKAVTVNEVQYSSDIFRYWSEAELNLIGIYRVVEVPQPVATNIQVVSEGDIALVAGVPTQTWVVSDMFTDTVSYTGMDGVVVPAKTKLQNETEHLAKLALEQQTQLKDHFKSMYLAHVDAKLKTLDYDSLATVKLWEGDATFGAEATRILTWYKAIIAMNYALITNVSTGVASVPTDTEYQTMLDAVVF